MSILSQTGDDTETLNKLEARIQAGFQDGVPPHLLSSAKSRTYTPGSNQSRMFVASHSEFSSLHPRDVQRILRERLILVHGTPFDYQYGWDLESFGRLHDVDKKITVNGEIGLPFLQAVITKTTFSLYKSSSPPARASPLPGNVKATTHHNDHSVKSGLSSPQRHFTTGIPEESEHSLSVWEHGVARSRPISHSF
jgi:hypothetical protein